MLFISDPRSVHRATLITDPACPPTGDQRLWLALRVSERLWVTAVAWCARKRPAAPFHRPAPLGAPPADARGRVRWARGKSAALWLTGHIIRVCWAGRCTVKTHKSMLRTRESHMTDVTRTHWPSAGCARARGISCRVLWWLQRCARSTTATHVECTFKVYVM